MILKDTLYKKDIHVSTVHHFLYTLAHYVDLILIMIHFTYGRSHFHRARVRDSRGVSPRGYDGPQAPSCVGANIVCEQGNPQCIPPIILVFLLNHYFMLSLIVH
jgi:hypothetical protein